MNFNEFKYNRPSIRASFSVEEKKRAFYSNYISYRLVFDEPISFNEDSIWGFCDGRNVYIRGEDEFLGKNNYDKIVYVGRYCFFYRFEKNSPAGGGGIFAKILNMNNGKDFYLVWKKTLKMILEKDPELLTEFKNDKEFLGFFYYIKKYSEKHKEEIKR